MHALASRRSACHCAGAPRPHHLGSPRVLVARCSPQNSEQGRETGVGVAEPKPDSSSGAPSTSSQPPAATATGSGLAADTNRRGPKRQAESTDAVSTFLTRRFGLAGGLAWLGFLAVGSLGEQVKTRWEVSELEKGIKDVDVSAQKEVVLPSGVRYTDLKTGAGQTPPKGFLVVLNYVGRANGQVFEDTYARGKPIVLFFGSRPFTGGMCQGAEEALSTMRAGGKRRVVVPAALGFGSQGAVLRPTEHVPDKQGVIPPDAELEYELELVRMSIPPS